MRRGIMKHVQSLQNVKVLPFSPLSQSSLIAEKAEKSKLCTSTCNFVGGYCNKIKAEEKDLRGST
jgi:hypothetical protein